jgi:anti-sigma factor RsiW
MDCNTVRAKLACYMDGALGASQMREVSLHLIVCSACDARLQGLSRARRALEALPALQPPAHLVTRLRILASRESARRAARLDLAALAANLRARTRVWAGNFMRPVALPFAGGLVSTILLFALLAPNLALPSDSGGADVPTMLSTGASFVSMGPFGFAGDEVTLELLVDSRGRVVGYSAPGGERWLKDPEMRRRMENNLLFTLCEPGTTFGMPSPGKVRITMRRSQMDVRAY